MQSKFEKVLWKKLEEINKRRGNRFESSLRKTHILPDGRKKKSFISNHHDFVVGLALLKETNNQSGVFTIEYRPGPEDIFLDLPAGSMEPNEDISDAMARELAEETGYAGEVIHVDTSWNAPYSNSKRHSFVVKDCVKVGPQKLDKDEFIEVIEMDLREFLSDYVFKGKTTNGASILQCLKHLGVFKNSFGI